MKTLGYSTGALALSDYRRALDMLKDQPVAAVELSAIREQELTPLLRSLGELDLSQFEYVSIHAPSEFPAESESAGSFKNYMTSGIVGGLSSFIRTPSMTSHFGGSSATCFASKTWTSGSLWDVRCGNLRIFS